MTPIMSNAQGGDAFLDRSSPDLDEVGEYSGKLPRRTPAPER